MSNEEAIALLNMSLSLTPDLSRGGELAENIRGEYEEGAWKWE
jgi:hypothetical protein